MKKHIILFATALFFTLTAFAQTTSYEAAMGQNLEALGKAKTVEEYQQVANLFERIAGTEQKQWLPLYYASLSYINMCNHEKGNDKKDAYLDKAQDYLQKALKLEPNESELHALQGLLHMVRIQVSPMARGMKYSGMATAALEKAKSINPDNPRVHYLMGSNLFHTPSMFGGGPAAAKPYFEQAKTKYETQKQANSFAPSWGKAQNDSMLARCN